MELYEYDNYRHFLRDFVTTQKAEERNFSIRSLARQCGFGSHSFLVHVLKGERNLRMDSVERLLPVLQLFGRKAAYFRSLVLYNQAQTASERQRYLEELRHIRGASAFARIQKDQWAYYSYWYLPVLRELVVEAPWKGDYIRLAKMIYPPITARAAQDGVALLLRIGLIRKLAGERYALTNHVVSAEGIPGVVFREARSQYMLRAIEASETLGPDQRHASYTVLGTSLDAYQKISQKMDELRREILNTYTKDEPVECVFAVNLQAFPVSTTFGQSDLKNREAK